MGRMYRVLRPRVVARTSATITEFAMMARAIAKRASDTTIAPSKCAPTGALTMASVSTELAFATLDSLGLTAVNVLAPRIAPGTVRAAKETARAVKVTRAPTALSSVAPVIAAVPPMDPALLVCASATVTGLRLIAALLRAPCLMASCAPGTGLAVAMEFASATLGTRVRCVHRRCAPRIATITVFALTLLASATPGTGVSPVASRSARLSASSTDPATMALACASLAGRAWRAR